VSTTRFAAATALLAAVLIVASACTPAGGSHGQQQLPGTREFALNDKQFNQHVEKTQQLISDCMQRAGFEYIPVDVKTVEAAQARVRADPSLPRVPYKKKYGYGATTRFDDPVRDVGLGPNLEIWHGLPPDEQEAYSRTLWGQDPKQDFVWAFDEEDFSKTGGCTREAVAQVFTPAQLRGSYVNPKDVLVESDPRIVKAERQWRGCMHRKGYDYGDQDEIIAEYEERLDTLLDGDDPKSLTGPRLDALHKLQHAEIKVSLADVGCEIKYTDEPYREVEIDIFGHPVSTP
jgi:hypothetical protein